MKSLLIKIGVGVSLGVNLFIFAALLYNLKMYDKRVDENRKFINFGGGMGDLWWYAESNRKFLNEVVIPSLQKPGWESQFFKSWDKNGRWEQYN